MTTQDVNELRAEISSLEQRVRDVHKQRIKAETYARSAASRLSEMEAEIKRLRDAMRLIANRPTNIPMDPHGMAQFARAALEQQQKGEGAEQ